MVETARSLLKLGIYDVICVVVAFNVSMMFMCEKKTGVLFIYLVFDRGMDSFGVKYGDGGGERCMNVDRVSL